MTRINSDSEAVRTLQEDLRSLQQRTESTVSELQELLREISDLGDSPTAIQSAVNIADEEVSRQSQLIRHLEDIAEFLES